MPMVARMTPAPDDLEDTESHPHRQNPFVDFDNLEIINFAAQLNKLPHQHLLLDDYLISSRKVRLAGSVGMDLKVFPTRNSC